MEWNEIELNEIYDAGGNIQVIYKDDKAIVTKSLINGFVYVWRSTNLSDKSEMALWSKAEPRRPDESLYYEFNSSYVDFSRAKDSDGHKIKSAAYSIDHFREFSIKGAAYHAFRKIDGFYVPVDFDPFVVYADGSIKFVDELENN